MQTAIDWVSTALLLTLAAAAGSLYLSNLQWYRKHCREWWWVHPPEYPLTRLQNHHRVAPAASRTADRKRSPTGT